MNKMIDPSLKNNQGFTLIEGLIALAIFAIFIPLFFSLNSYIDRSFSIANRQSDLQFYSRLAKIQIEKEIQYVNSLEILSSAPSLENFSSGTEKAICVNADQELVRLTKNAAGNLVETPLMQNVPDDLEMSLAFEKIIAENGGEDLYGNKLLGFVITCSSADETVSLESSKLIKDTNVADELSIDGDTGSAIIYE